MKTLRNLVVSLLVLCCAAYANAQATAGVCWSNVAQSIANGVLVPLPFSQVYVCPVTTSTSTCMSTSSSITLYATSALTGLPLTNPLTTDAGGNFFFCASPQHVGVAIVASVGNYMVPDLTLANDWTHGGIVVGTWQATQFVGPLTGNATTSSAFDHTPTQCSAQQYFAGIAANGNANGCTPLPTLYYQTVQLQAVSQTQRSRLNFLSSFFTAADNAGNGSTDVGLQGTLPVSVTGNANTASAFNHTPTTCTTGQVPSGVDSGGNAICGTQVDYYWTITGCSAPISQPSRCTGTTTLPGPMPDANYQVFCGTNDITSPTNGSTVCSLYNNGTLPTASGASFTYQVLQVVQNSSGGATPQVYFHAHHN